MFNFKKKAYKKFDYILFLTTLLLCGYGLLMIKSATLSKETMSYVKTQGIATIIGLVAIIILVLLDYEFLGKLYIPIYAVCNILLIAVLVFGTGDKDWGSRSWLTVGPITFQPAEFVKIGLIISLAKFIDNHKENINDPFTLLKILAFAFAPVVLILLQPDAGTAMVFIFFIAVMLFIAGIKWKYIGYTFLIGLFSLPLLWFKLGDYQKNRILNFLDPERDLADSGLQAHQGKIAIGSGKIFGRGLFQGAQTQFNYIPEKQTDFIFSVIGEELGLMGGLGLIFLYFILLSRFILIARKSKDLFGSLMIVGFTAMFLFHIWENIGMTMGLMPITGIPLPFISHGGTFQLSNMICIGIILSVSVHREELSF
ncbi:rod shape-determining protein RodA [Tissierella sp. P1]|uniref:rod shape-determining protein RodA n=1 Tax=Tissierella TaxID=41273 RepID=UPI000BA01E2C|nr:rod shape-determining protein RodA [Tissierella sp. P1]MDU5081754.1 rod shape-determining protein RodA [Bacillota bacterium]OZV12448.1 rod shape-determining protein RodA [Tissierella sp. P1]